MTHSDRLYVTASIAIPSAAFARTPARPNRRRSKGKATVSYRLSETATIPPPTPGHRPLLTPSPPIHTTALVRRPPRPNRRRCAPCRRASTSRRSTRQSFHLNDRRRPPPSIPYHQRRSERGLPQESYRKLSTGRDADACTPTVADAVASPPHDCIRRPTANPPSSLRSTTNLPSAPCRRASTSCRSTRQPSHLKNDRRPPLSICSGHRKKQLYKLSTNRNGNHPTADAWTPTAADAVVPGPRDRQPMHRPRSDRRRIYRPPRIAAPRRVANLHDNIPTSQTTTIPRPIPSDRSPPDRIDTHKGKATI